MLSFGSLTNVQENERIHEDFQINEGRDLLDQLQPTIYTVATESKKPGLLNKAQVIYTDKGIDPTML